MIIPCGCQDGGIRRIEGKLDTLCDFVQTCNQLPLMWCQPRNKGRFFNTLVKSPCRQLPCCPKICLPPTQTCLPVNNCCSRQRSWNLLLISKRGCYLENIAPPCETYSPYCSCQDKAPWCPGDADTEASHSPQPALHLSPRAATPGVLAKFCSLKKVPNVSEIWI
uniref:anthrax toxin receptor-like n=1 Tax=Halichoerus grypus TaxID=9711 RepID=UPI001659C0A4|nr:anthrax toxin receptor-like [Halichoerus grypus]